MQIVKHSQSRSVRWPQRMRRCARLGLVATAGLLGACTSLADMLTPGQRNADLAPAMLSFQANIALASNHEAEVVSLDVATTYLRRDGSEVPVSTQSRRLSSAELQPVPIPVDVATCLADPERDGNSGSCAVMLNLTLLVNGVVVDRQIVGPIRLTPGLPATLPSAVTLFEIADVALLDADGTVLAPEATLALTPGSTRALSARVRDSRGSPVTDRPVSWRSDAPQVASISSTGVVTAVSAGSARFTASLGALSASVSATIARPPVALTVAGALGSGRGTVRSTPVGIDCRVNEAETSGSCSAEFPASARVTLRSVPDDRNRFAIWGDACSTAGDNAECAITLEEARRATAQFHAVRTLTIDATAGADGAGRIVGNGLDCRLADASTSGTCEIDVLDGTEVVLSATSVGVASRQRFAGWSGACASSSAAECTITVRGGDTRIGAGFLDVRALSVQLAGAGGGAVLGLPEAACARVDGTTEGACATSVEHGSEITLSVAPDARSEFGGWSGACDGTEPTCTVTLTTAQSVTATFSRRRVALTMLVAGPGAGVVQLDGEPFCTVALSAADATCTRLLDAGTRVDVRGVPTGALSRFDGFSGACEGTGTCTLEVNAPRSVRAEFALVPVSVSVVSSGTSTGSGRVLADGGIDCTITLGTLAPGGCAMTVNPFAPVSFTAQAAPASALVAWGDVCANATSTTCTITPTGPAAVSARFTAAIDVQMIMALSTGAGSVTFSVPGVPSQPMCTSTAGVVNSCRFSLPIGATGVFRGVPAPGYQFIGFRGPCLEGTGPVPVCTYRGFGFVREIEAYFQRP
jgi:hypothetical protein